MRMVGNAAEAEDMTQETFCNCTARLPPSAATRPFPPGLHRLAINVVLMQLRKKGLSLISMDEAMEPDPKGSPSRGFGALDLSLSGSIDRMALECAVSDLPAGYRLVFVLHDIEGYEHHEIASMLDCSVGNSKSQLHKARLTLREALHSHPRQEARP